VTTTTPLEDLHERFKEISDPRVLRQQKHIFSEVIVLTIVSFIGTCNDWASVERFTKTRIEWFRTFLTLPGGVPSHDTIGRIFAMLDPEEFSAIWEEWVREVCAVVGLKQVAIDGKTMRGSGSDKRQALHVVTAFATENGLSLGQVVVDQKSNEIAAIPELLKKLDIRRAVVTIDAIGCQKEIAATVVEQGADFVLAVKENQPKLHAAIHAYAMMAMECDYEGIDCDRYSKTEKSHGREETRTCYVFRDTEAIGISAEWRDVKTVIVVVSDRTVKGKSSSEVRYYISSRVASAEEMYQYVRKHWRIENNLHWQLDISYREDDSMLREGHGPENAALLKRITLSILKNATVGKEKWISGKRQYASWDLNIMNSIIQQFLGI
jgi:predicted transposase YbfD/YdcC